MAMAAHRPRRSCRGRDPVAAAVLAAGRQARTGQCRIADGRPASAGHARPGSLPARSMSRPRPIPAWPCATRPGWKPRPSRVETALDDSLRPAAARRLRCCSSMAAGCRWRSRTGNGPPNAASLTSVLYRIAVESALPLAEDRLYRLDATIDHAPEIRVIEPERTLNQVGDGQRSLVAAISKSTTTSASATRACA